VFGLFKILYKKERQSKGIKREICKIYRALLTFYQDTIIPMDCWSSERAIFRFNPSGLLGAVTVNPTAVFEPIDVPELPFDDIFLYPERWRPDQLPQSERRWRQRIPGPTEFATNLIAYVDPTIGKSPVCGHEEDEETSDEEEESND
jgi:hypothetical protein